MPKQAATQQERRKDDGGGYAIVDSVIGGVGPTIVDAAQDAEDMLRGDGQDGLAAGPMRIQRCCLH